MNRRRLLAVAGTLASSLLAGCLGDEGSSEPGTSAGTETGSTTPTATTTTAATATPTTRTTTATPKSTRVTKTAEPTARSETPPSSTRPSTQSPGSPTPSSSNRIVDRALTVGDRACGNPTNEGTVAFDEGRVVVTGTVTGSDSCTTAVLDEATYDATANRLRVVVATESERAAGTTCAQCLSEIDYEATVAFANGVPKTVVLVHRGATGETRVTTATP